MSIHSTFQHPIASVAPRDLSCLSRQLLIDLPIVKLRQLEYFVIVAVEQLDRAALRLHVAQPSFSVRSRHSKRRLELDLLSAINATFFFTQAGKRYFSGTRARFCRWRKPQRSRRVGRSW